MGNPDLRDEYIVATEIDPSESFIVPAVCELQNGTSDLVDNVVADVHARRFELNGFTELTVRSVLGKGKFSENQVMEMLLLRVQYGVSESEKLFDLILDSKIDLSAKIQLMKDCIEASPLFENVGDVQLEEGNFNVHVQNIVQIAKVLIVLLIKNGLDLEIVESIKLLLQRVESVLPEGYKKRGEFKKWVGRYARN